MRKSGKNKFPENKGTPTLAQLHASLQKELAVRRVMNEFAAVLISERNIGDITEHVLNAALRLTASPLGFVGFIDPLSGQLVAPTMTRQIWDECQVPGKSFVFSHFKGLWGWVLRERQPLLCNDLAHDPRSQGIPSGHMPIVRFLGVPALIGKELFGEIALANKEAPYDEADLNLARRLAALYAIALQRQRLETTQQKMIAELRQALAEVKRLSGLLPICASCKKVRDDKGYWQQIEDYISEHSEADFSHSLCPDCMKKLYPGFTARKNKL
jgi:hypothetical protein